MKVILLTKKIKENNESNSVSRKKMKVMKIGMKLQDAS
jgi:hypothetical protein